MIKCNINYIITQVKQVSLANKIGDLNANIDESTIWSETS